MSYRAIVSQYGVSPRSEAWRTSANHTETPNRRRATRPARNISQHSRNPPARNTRHITRSSSTGRIICGRRIPPGKRRVETMHRIQSRFPWSPGGAVRRDRLHAAAKAKKNLVTSTGGATPRPLENSPKPAPGPSSGRTAGESHTLAHRRRISPSPMSPYLRHRPYHRPAPGTNRNGDTATPETIPP